MGCGESKIEKISLTSQTDWELQPDRTKRLWEAAAGSDQWAGLDTKGVLPNSLLATIPSSELGESLDCRPERTVAAGLARSAPVSASSLGRAGRGGAGRAESFCLTDYFQTAETAATRSTRRSTATSSPSTAASTRWSRSSGTSPRWTCPSSW